MSRAAAFLLLVQLLGAAGSPLEREPAGLAATIVSLSGNKRVVLDDDLAVNMLPPSDAEAGVITNNHQEADSRLSEPARRYGFAAGQHLALLAGQQPQQVSAHKRNHKKYHKRGQLGSLAKLDLFRPSPYFERPAASFGASPEPASAESDNELNLSGPLPAKPDESRPAEPALNCGRQQVSAGRREPRIVGGNATVEGEFPWAVSIQRNGNHHCGGVILAAHWILTAAHCVRNQLVGNLLVRTGGNTLSHGGGFERDYAVEQIIMHGDFSRFDALAAGPQVKPSSHTTNNADIALLRLRRDIAWHELAWPVCLGRELELAGQEATVVGWGKLGEKSDDFSNELHKVRLTIIDNRQCQNWFMQAGRDMPIDERIICAGQKSGGRDACHGDSGGPLLSKLDGRYAVVGVVSTGIGCARPLLPGLYSRVSSYLAWIERHLAT